MALFSDACCFALEAQPRFIKFAKLDARALESAGRLSFVVACLLGAFWLWRTSRLTELEKKAAVAAGIVHFFLSTTLDLLAVNAGLYRSLLSRQLLWGIAFDIHLGWAALWGTGLCLAWVRLPSRSRWGVLGVLIGLTLALDFLALQSGRVFTTARADWWAWDLGALIFLALFTLLFFKLIRENRVLILRAALYGLIYFVVFYVLIPALILTLGDRRSFDPISILKPWSWLALAVVALPGAWAAVQFALSGNGTPLPLDPTRRLVTNGVYAHVRNPMQLSGLLSAVIWALATGSLFMWIYVLDLVLLFLFVKKFEEQELLGRFGLEYEKYAAGVKKWIPRITPYR